VSKLGPDSIGVDRQNSSSRLPRRWSIGLGERSGPNIRRRRLAAGAREDRAQRRGWHVALQAEDGAVRAGYKELRRQPLTGLEWEVRSLFSGPGMMVQPILLNKE